MHRPLQNKWGGTWILAGTLALNLGLLFYFKYFDFALTVFNDIFHSKVPLFHIVLPVGISFFTFQGMSYTIDVYRKEVPAQKKLYIVALYIMLFPQLIAGPIVRYKDIEHEIETRTVVFEDVVSGIERFIIGLAKKAIIANAMAEVADAIWRVPTLISWDIAWVGALAYMLQIYYDFSGYSDMAIGLGRVFGFHFLENFNLPYISCTVSEFWRRWHRSLSTWFRDYVYIPLGGNRKRVYLNLMIVFLLTGIWHGASYHYILWGVWNGVFLLIERRLRMHKKDLSTSSLWVRFGMKTYTLLVVLLGWVLFRATSTKEAIRYGLTMFGIWHNPFIGFDLPWFINGFVIVLMALGIFFASSLPTRCCAWLEQAIPTSLYAVLKLVVLCLLLFVCMVRIMSGTYNPFIYFQF